MPKPTKTEEKSVAKIDWGQHQVTGFEHASAEDFGIPFISIIQPKSPQVDKTDKNYANKKIEGAEPGMFFNNIENRLISSKDRDYMRFIPCAYERVYIEWAPRKSGGGIVHVHKTPAILNETTRNEKNQDELKNGNIVVTTAQFYGMYQDQDGAWVPGIIAMSSTQLKKSRYWLNMMKAQKQNGVPLPMFSHIYTLSTVAESNEDGSWFGWKIDVSDMVDDPELVTMAVDTAKVVAEGKLQQLGQGSKKNDEDNPPFA
jgi:hypothetical protein